MKTEFKIDLNKDSKKGIGVRIFVEELVLRLGLVLWLFVSLGILMGKNSHLRTRK